MRIATFNLENLGGDRPAVELEERVRVLRPQLDRLHADVLCLQEVNAARKSKNEQRQTYALDELLKGTGFEDFQQATSVKPGTSALADRHNLVTLSRWPILDQQQCFHDKVLPPVSTYAMANPRRTGATSLKWDRPILYVKLDTPAGPLHVLNLHLRAPLASAIPGQKHSQFKWNTVSGWAEGFYISAIKRSGQALEARMIVDEIFDNDEEAKIAVTGDFNAEMRETPFKILSGNVEDTGNGDLAARSLVPVERSLPENRCFSIIHAGRHIMLDHILVSRGLLANYKNVEVHNETLADEFVGYATGVADPGTHHAPVVAEFNSREVTS
ncbi:MAG: endonuclease/exonuclease/phosphatase family protein [Hyphomicrobiales bacterium]